jgi:hypothetical protein
LATVITNLLSAIPWIGEDFVQSKNITEYYSIMETASILPVIGTVSPHAIKKGNKNKRLDNKEYLSIPPSFVAFFAGFVDGDGYLQIVRTTKGYISISLIIGVHLDDISTLEYIKSVLKLGKLTVHPDIKNPICKLIINRTDLQEVIFPLFIHHGIFFLTETRRAQFDLAMYILQNEIKHYDQIQAISHSPGGKSSVFELPGTASDYMNLPFFKNWIVGFTQAEGSFFVKNNNDGCYSLKQAAARRVHSMLFEAFKLVFGTNRKIVSEKGLYNQICVSSKADIQRVINFFSFSGHHPLVGLKCIQYLKWLTILRNSYRYRNLKFPE